MRQAGCGFHLPRQAVCCVLVSIGSFGLFNPISHPHEAGLAPFDSVQHRRCLSSGQPPQTDVASAFQSPRLLPGLQPEAGYGRFLDGSLRPGQGHPLASAPERELVIIVD